MGRAIIRQVLGAFLDAATSETMQWLEEEQTLKYVAYRQPQRVVVLHVSELVSQQAFLPIYV
jgi:hypothetical protein